ncbi:Solitary outer membrane autotransporter beta-barrel domain [Vibrio hangzhouensis]|uniref:Solitary outer membrane autotransporter beta-barrel domain-containing protein n=1 Tax=Vibrio hangzhouensis TaxID=462991 RepID=A0A1H5WPP2_9VIBR|nr:Solitary outer membrane autotransporter beta-barrel domain [Vibrio hangzhouensis]SEG01330.1 Solitary outer membrane autotransporter beta-barrel domain-containing protein [Vibrio hangzhouensis]
MSTSRTILLVGICAVSTQVQANPLFRDIFEEDFAAAIILTDSNALTLGFKDFDPNTLLNIDNENIGSKEALDLRKNIAVSSLPLTFSLRNNNDFQQRGVVRFSALKIEDEILESPDNHTKYVLGVFSGYEQDIRFSEHWQFQTGVGVHLQYLHSNYDFNSELSKLFQPFIDGKVVNTSAWAANFHPKIGFNYENRKRWGDVKFQSSFNYFTGVGWGKANDGDVGTPEGWYWSNEAKLFYDVADWGRSIQTVYTSLRRVDIGGDTLGVLGASHYYEGTVGWLMTPPFHIQFVDNVGIGLSVNYGSALKGGSIVLFFNQE